MRIAVGETHGIGYMLTQPWKGLNLIIHDILKCWIEICTIKPWFPMD